ncbi:uncharacterized protein [Acropora muricata]|uniref:uncharacterized protein n=1 Tax=Acropora muricata TaxID=159855 RepID=UPI0034E4B7D9
MKISKVFYIAGALLLLANISPTSGFPRNNRERSSARKDARILEDSLLTEGRSYTSRKRSTSDDPTVLQKFVSKRTAVTTNRKATANALKPIKAKKIGHKARHAALKQETTEASATKKADIVEKSRQEIAHVLDILRPYKEFLIAGSVLLIVLIGICCCCCCICRRLRRRDKYGLDEDAASQAAEGYYENMNWDNDLGPLPPVPDEPPYGGEPAPPPPPPPPPYGGGQ